MSLRGFIGETGSRGLYRGGFQPASSAFIDEKSRAGDKNARPLQDVRWIQCLVQ